MIRSYHEMMDRYQEHQKLRVRLSRMNEAYGAWGQKGYPHMAAKFDHDAVRAKIDTYRHSQEYERARLISEWRTILKEKGRDLRDLLLDIYRMARHKEV